MRNEAELYTLGALANTRIREAVILRGVKAEWFTGEREEAAKVLIETFDQWMHHYPPIDGHLGQEISQFSMHVGNWEYFTEELSKQYKARRSAPIALAIGQAANEGNDATELIKELNGIQSEGSGFKSNPAYSEEWESYFNGNRTILSTGFKTCDAFFPIYHGEYVIIAGRPSAGKTSFLVAALLNMARQGREILYFSLDDPFRATLEKLLCLASNSESGDVKNEDNLKQAMDTLKDIEALPLEIAPQQIVRLEDILMYAEKQKKLNPKLSVIAVDHLTKILAPGKSAYERTTTITTELFALTKRLDVTVMAVSQLNRESEKEGRELRMSDLRDSGAIEQDSSKILAFSTPDRKDGAKEWEVICNLLKNKMGPRGKINFTFNGPKYSFTEHTNE